jgi:thioredoxin-related protein
VDGLEQEYGQRISVERVNFISERGQALARRYQIRAHPAIVVIDASGTAVLTLPGEIGAAGRTQIVAAITALQR